MSERECLINLNSQKQEEKRILIRMYLDVLCKKHIIHATYIQTPGVIYLWVLITVFAGNAKRLSFLVIWILTGLYREYKTKKNLHRYKLVHSCYFNYQFKRSRTVLIVSMLHVVHVQYMKTLVETFSSFTF